MDVFYASALSLLFVLVSVALHMVFNKSKHAVKGKLPPGNKGWLVIGETFEFLGTGRNGHPEKFFTDRMAKFSREVFRTSLLREDAAVFCGSAGNKFLFSNENKLVRLWWPSSVHKIFPTNQMSPIEDLKMRTMLLNCLKPESLYQYVPIMDMVTQTHFENEWKDKNEIVTYELVKNLTFSLTCKIFLSIDEPTRVKNLSAPFGCVTLGILSIPIDLPGTRFRKGINAANFIRKELIAIIKQRKSDLSYGKASSNQDMLSYMVLFSDENGEQMTENNIADKILGLLIAGHDTVSSACSLVVKFLSEFPEVYEGVYAEQMDIARSKESGELLNRNDILKMKYSWNVACEILRLAPPLQGAFREAITDFVYNGYSIPKGWKLYWSTFSTHKNPEYFPEPQKFDPSRFDGKGPAPYTFVPFGGGPRMCPGKEFARMQILIFMHHLVRKFKWEKVFPDEKIIMNPLSVPAMGLPIRLYPRKA